MVICRFITVTIVFYQLSETGDVTAKDGGGLELRISLDHMHACTCLGPWISVKIGPNTSTKGSGKACVRNIGLGFCLLDGEA